MPNSHSTQYDRVRILLRVVVILCQTVAVVPNPSYEADMLECTTNGELICRREVAIIIESDPPKHIIKIKEPFSPVEYYDGKKFLIKKAFSSPFYISFLLVHGKRETNHAEFTFQIVDFQRPVPEFNQAFINIYDGQQTRLYESVRATKLPATYQGLLAYIQLGSFKKTNYSFTLTTPGNLEYRKRDAVQAETTENLLVLFLPCVNALLYGRRENAEIVRLDFHRKLKLYSDTEEGTKSTCAKLCGVEGVLDIEDKLNSFNSFDIRRPYAGKIVKEQFNFTGVTEQEDEGRIAVFKRIEHPPAVEVTSGHLLFMVHSMYGVASILEFRVLTPLTSVPATSDEVDFQARIHPVMARRLIVSLGPPEDFGREVFTYGLFEALTGKKMVDVVLQNFGELHGTTFFTIKIKSAASLNTEQAHPMTAHTVAVETLIKSLNLIRKKSTNAPLKTPNINQTISLEGDNANSFAGPFNSVPSSLRKDSRLGLTSRSQKKWTMRRCGPFGDPIKGFLEIDMISIDSQFFRFVDTPPKHDHFTYRIDCVDNKFLPRFFKFTQVDETTIAGQVTKGISWPQTILSKFIPAIGAPHEHVVQKYMDTLGSGMKYLGSTLLIKAANWCTRCQKYNYKDTSLEHSDATKNIFSYEFRMWDGHNRWKSLKVFIPMNKKPFFVAMVGPYTLHPIGKLGICELSSFPPLALSPKHTDDLTNQAFEMRFTLGGDVVLNTEPAVGTIYAVTAITNEDSFKEYVVASKEGDTMYFVPTTHFECASFTDGDRKRYLDVYHCGTFILSCIVENIGDRNYKILEGVPQFLTKEDLPGKLKFIVSKTTDAAPLEQPNNLFYVLQDDVFKPLETERKVVQKKKSTTSIKKSIKKIAPLFTDEVLREESLTSS